MRTKVSIYPGLFLLCAVLLLMLPLRWILAAMCSIAVHELCHMLAIRAFHKKIYHVQVGMSGAKLSTEPLSNIQELFCAMAGPGSFFIALVVCRWFPRYAICSAFHTAYNLLPVYPLDGGRILLCLTRLFLSERSAVRISLVCEYICVCGIIFAGFFGSFVLHLGIFPIGLSWIIAWRTLFRKIPCKPTQLRVQ